MPTVLFDNITYARRTDVPVAIISFFQQIPGHGDRLEVFRGVTTMEHVKKMIALLCRNADYFPTKDEAAKLLPAKKAGKV